MGTSVGTKVFLEHGWRACAGVTLAYAGWQIFILLLRGPNCGRFTWIGWEGGWEGRIRKVKGDVGEGENGNANTRVEAKGDKDVEKGNGSQS